MKKVLGAIAITAAMLATTAAFAGTNAVESAQKRIHAEWDKSRAQGGYGFPLTAIPAAIASAFTGKDSAVTAGQRGTAMTDFTGLGEQRRDQPADRWDGPRPSGRAHDRAEH